MGWRTVTGRQPPQAPECPDASWGQPTAWARRLVRWSAWRGSSRIARPRPTTGRTQDGCGDSCGRRSKVMTPDRQRLHAGPCRGGRRPFPLAAASSTIRTPRCDRSGGRCPDARLCRVAHPLKGLLHAQAEVGAPVVASVQGSHDEPADPRDRHGNLAGLRDQGERLRSTLGSRVRCRWVGADRRSQGRGDHRPGLWLGPNGTGLRRQDVTTIPSRIDRVTRGE